MACPLWLLDFALLVNRVLLGLLFIFVAKMKFGIGVSNFVANMYNKMVPPWVPHWFSAPYGYAIPWFEMIFGALLLLGVFTRLVSVILFLMVASFTIAMAHGGMLGGQRGIIDPNYIDMGLLVLLMAAGGGRLSLDHRFCRRCRAAKSAEPRL